jgi:hypothetical protein
LNKELVTEILDEQRWQSAVAIIVAFLASKQVESVEVEFGFVLERDLRGETAPEDRTVPLHQLECVIEDGLQQGTIEWAGTSDFIFAAVGTDLKFKLCNDADLHVSSADSALLKNIANALSAGGVKVFE